MFEGLKSKFIGSKVKAEEPTDMVKRLTEAEKNTLSDCINDLIWTEEIKNSNLVAVYITAYWEDGTVHIYVNFVDSSYCADDCIVVCCKVKGIKIDKVMKSPEGFSYKPRKDAETLKNAQELSDCFYHKIYYKWNGRADWYETNIGYANKTGITESNRTATFEPPLTLTK